MPYLLSEHVERNLLNLLKDKCTKLTHHDKVSIVQDIASGLSFLHLRRPRAIVHGALDSRWFRMLYVSKSILCLIIIK